MNRVVITAIILAAVLCPLQSRAQGCGNLDLQFQTDIPSTCSAVTMTMIQDQMGRPYLYVAAKDGGLRVYDVADVHFPHLVDSVPITTLQSLHVMNVTQNGNYLYLTLGNTFGNADQSPGVAIVDVSDPSACYVTTVYRYPSSRGGGGIVKVDGNYAYFGAMNHGLVILDVTSKYAIRFVSDLIPDIYFPSSKPDTLKINARGMAVRNDTVYLCYDAGGFRIIDTKDKVHPREIGRYSNPALDNLPRAYNNVVIDDTLAFVTFDYCGVEVLNISNPAQIKLVSWWNPWNCQTNPFNWFSSAGHANEIEYNKETKLLFVATGKSDLYVLNAWNPKQLDSCANYGGIDNGTGTWGVSTYSNRIYLSYICTLGIPFASNWTGVKILTYNNPAATVAKSVTANSLQVYPNPSRDQLILIPESPFEGVVTASLISPIGFVLPVRSEVADGNLNVVLPQCPSGMYFIKVESGERSYVQKISILE
jgi:hypothetical protein